jgi:hypothetical protein
MHLIPGQGVETGNLRRFIQQHFRRAQVLLPALPRLGPQPVVDLIHAAVEEIAGARPVQVFDAATVGKANTHSSPRRIRPSRRWADVNFTGCSRACQKAVCSTAVISMT